MIELTARPARTSFSGPEKQLKKMFRCLRVKDKSSYWRQRYALKRVGYFSDVQDPDERNKKIEQLKESTRWIKFYDRRSDTFATGLLGRVKRFLLKKGIKFSVTDHRQKIPQFKKVTKFHFEDKVETRPEQLEAVNAALQRGRGIIHMATNAGKTECACAIIVEYYRQTQQVPRVLFLAHRVGLVQQTADRFRKHLPDSVRIVTLGGGEKSIPKERAILVATVQTASNLLSRLDFERFQEKCDILYIDELHINKAWQCSHIVNQNEAPMRFSLSGTVDKENKIKMLHYVGMTGPIIAETKNKELVDLGRSAKPIIRFLEVNSEEIPKRSGFAAGYRLGIVQNEIRNEMVIKETLRYLEKDYKTLVTVSRISHGMRLKRMFEKEIDLPVEFLSGSTPMDIRKRVIQRFEKGKIGVLIGSQIFDTGVDIPSIAAWVAAGGGLGWELVLQRLGRVLRRKEGENKVYISDFVDLHNRYLMKHSLARMRHYQNEKIADISIVTKEKKSV